MASLDFDALKTESYDPDLYRADAVVEPLSGFDAVDSAKLEQYRTLGFLSVANAYPPEMVRGFIEAMQDLILMDLPPGVHLQFESAAKGKVEHVPREERLDFVRKFMAFYHLDPRLIAMAEHPPVLEAVGRLLGAEPEVFQDMALLKPPGIGREKPWHQDHAYFNLPAGTPVVGVWIALDEATTENGCMVFLPGGHHDGPLPHWNRRDWQICDSDILERSGKVACPLPSGGCLIFDGLTPHGTATNTSNTRRRAVQFHYIPKGTPRITTEERMALFGNEGRDVTC